MVKVAESFSLHGTSLHLILNFTETGVIASDFFIFNRFGIIPVCKLVW